MGTEEEGTEGKGEEVTPNKKRAAWIWVLLVVAIGMWPPWAYDHVGEGDTPNTMGHHFIFTWDRAGRIDTSRLLVEWGMATALAAGLYFAWPFREPKNP